MTALLLVDIQVGFLDLHWGRRNNPRFERQVARLLQDWRTRRLPVFHIRHLSRDPDSPLHPDRGQTDFIDCATPRPHEPVLAKNRHSAFIGTGLELELKKVAVQRLVIAGLTADHCVSTTARMAHDLGFEVLLPADAVATFARGSFDADTVQAVSLASLNQEFAEITTVDQILERAHL